MQRNKIITRLLAFSGCIALVTALCGCGDTKYDSGSPSTPPPTKTGAETAIKKAVDDYFNSANQYYTQVAGAPVPGTIVAVKLSGYQPMYYATGCAEIDLNSQVAFTVPACKTPMTTDMQFRIASVTKMFVADAIIKLIKEGKLSYDTTVESILPGALTGINLSNKNTITIKQLLNHTSGLYTYVTTDAGLTNGKNANGNLPMNKFVMNRGQKNWTHSSSPQDEVLQFVNSFNPDPTLVAADGTTKYLPYGVNPYFAPGADWHYSNTNYYLLGLIIEKVTGKTVDAEIKRLIADPLGLKDTYLPTTSSFNTSKFAHGYTDYFNKSFTNALDYAILQFHSNPSPNALLGAPYIAGDGILEDFSSVDPSFAWTTGGMISSAKDMLVFLENVINTRVKAREEASYWIMGSPMMGLTFEYGRGIVKIGGMNFGHGGQFAGYNIAAYWVAPLEAYIIVMTNKYSYHEDDPTAQSMGIGDISDKVLYKSSLYSSAPVEKDLNTGLVNAIISTLANQPDVADKIVGKSIDSLLIPDISSRLR